MTQQEVIRTFNRSLDKTNFSGRAALDEAIRASSHFANFEEFKNQFLADQKAAKNWHTFLVEKCGIILDNTDTGAISGADAGGDTVKTTTTILPAEGEAKYPSGSSFTVDGLTIYGIPARKRLNAAQQYIVQGLYSWWIRDALLLIKESYGYSFTDADTKAARLKLQFIDDDSITGLAYVDGAINDGKNTESRVLCVNVAKFKDVDPADHHGAAGGSFLAHTLVHELTHGIMASNVNYFQDFPGFLTEGGTAELIHGVDIERRYEIIAYAQKPDVLKNILTAVPNENSEDYVKYAGGYIIMRYFAKQAATDTTFDYDTYRPAVSVDDNNFAINYWDTVTMTGSDNSDTIVNSGENVTITAGASNDDIRNHSTNVTLDGGEDNDYIENSGAQASVNAGAGNDSIQNFGGFNATLDGGAGDDYIENNDSINLIVTPADTVESANVVIYGGTGNDTVGNSSKAAKVYGQDGADVIVNIGTQAYINGGESNDSILNRGSDSTLYGGAGNDSVTNSNASVKVYGQDGADFITNNSKNVTIDGGDGNDEIFNYKPERYTEFDEENVSINGGAGDDTVYNDGDGNYLSGGAGKDELLNYGDAISIDGGAGNDSVYSSGENVSINGGSGNDYLENEGYSATIAGSDGNDTIRNTGYHVTISGGKGDDVIINDGGKHIVYRFNGSCGKDTIQGFNDGDTIQITSGTYSATTSGSDVIVQVGNASMTLADTAGKRFYVVTASNTTDTINFYGTLLTLTDDDANKQTLGAGVINLNATTRTKITRVVGNALDNIISGGSGKDTIYGQNGDDLINGNYGNDRLSGQNGNDYLYGNDGNDSLSGGTGMDTLWGGAGNDTLTGGSGVDWFVYAPGEGDDTITDYQSGELIEITDSTFTNAVFASNKLTLTIDGGGSLTFDNVTTSTVFNINDNFYHVKGNTIK